MPDFEFSFGRRVFRNLLPLAKVFVIPTLSCDSSERVTTHRFKGWLCFLALPLLSLGKCLTDIKPMNSLAQKMCTR